MVVSLSVYEGFGIPVLEGLYAGCKVLCADIPVYHELYEGLVQYCDPADTDAVTRALEELAGVQPINISLPAAYDYARSAAIILENTLKQINI